MNIREVFPNCVPLRRIVGDYGGWLLDWHHKSL